jgi:two-component system cell cycle response regulator DivK
MSVSKVILVVDNDADTRYAVGAVLVNEGYQVAEAVSGEEAVEVALRIVPDLIIMDINMPGIGGLVAAGRIRAEERTREVPIVALTGELLGDQARASFAGQVFHSILWKPMTPAKLLLHVHAIIKGNLSALLVHGTSLAFPLWT